MTTVENCVISEEDRENKIEMLKELLSFWDSNDTTHYNQYHEGDIRCPCSVRWENLTWCGVETIWGIHGFRFD